MKRQLLIPVCSCLALAVVQAGAAPNSTKGAAQTPIKVTPAYVNAHPGSFSINSKEVKEGLLRFTVTRYVQSSPAEPLRLRPLLALEEGTKLHLTDNFQATTTPESVSYSFVVPAHSVGGARFTLAENRAGKELPSYSIPLAPFSGARNTPD